MTKRRLEAQRASLRSVCRDSTRRRPRRSTEQSRCSRGGAPTTCHLLRLDPSKTRRHPSHDERYADLDPKRLCLQPNALADVVERMLALLDAKRSFRISKTGRLVLVVAHGNSLRALVKELDGISEEDIVWSQYPNRNPSRLSIERGDETDLQSISWRCRGRQGRGRSGGQTGRLISRSTRSPTHLSPDHRRSLH